MEEKDVRKLSRTELLEMLIEQTKEVERLEGLLQEANSRLASRDLAIDEAGSIASAALQVNGVFDATQRAAEQYLENIRSLSGRQEELCARMEVEARDRASQMIAEAKERCVALENETVARCVALVQKAKTESEAYWDNVTLKLNQFINLHSELRELLQVAPSPASQGLERHIDS